MRRITRSNTRRWLEQRLRPEDCVHTLIAVHTDSGLVGLGSVFTNDALVQASLNLLKPLYMGESALEPERFPRSCISTCSGWDEVDP